MYAGQKAIASRVTLLQHVIVNANYFDGYVSMRQINQFQFQKTLVTTFCESNYCNYCTVATKTKIGPERYLGKT